MARSLQSCSRRMYHRVVCRISSSGMCLLDSVPSEPPKPDNCRSHTRAHARTVPGPYPTAALPTTPPPRPRLATEIEGDAACLVAEERLMASRSPPSRLHRPRPPHQRFQQMLNRMLPRHFPCRTRPPRHRPCRLQMSLQQCLVALRRPCQPPSCRLPHRHPWIPPRSSPSSPAHSCRRLNPPWIPR